MVTSASVPGFLICAFLPTATTWPLNALVGDGVDLDGGLVADADADDLVLAHLGLDLHVREAAHQDHHVLAEVGAADALADLVVELEDRCRRWAR